MHTHIHAQVIFGKCVGDLFFFGFSFSYSEFDGQDYLLDAPVSVGDGFSFSGGKNFLNRSVCSLREMLGFINWGFSVFLTGKYSDEPSPADEWFKQGKIVSSNCK